MVDLTTLVLPGSPLTVTAAAFINDRGEIYGTGVFPNGDQRVILLIPCDGDQSDNKKCEDNAGVDGAMTQSSPPVTRSLGGDTKGSSEATSDARSNRRYPMRRHAPWSKN